jgi:hypothetical protein
MFTGPICRDISVSAHALSALQTVRSRVANCPTFGKFAYTHKLFVGMHTGKIV